jgi:hypothetical protein
VPRLTREQASRVAALDSDPDHIAFEALRDGDREGRLDALQLWTTWRRADVARLLDARGALLSPVTEALIAGLQARVGRRLGHGERGAFDLLAQLYAGAGGTLPFECADEHGLLRVCERCDLVTRGARRAARCPECSHRHTDRITDGLPRFTPCPVCHVRPVSDSQKRCATCETERVKAKKAAQARRRRARKRDTSPPT